MSSVRTIGAVAVMSVIGLGTANAATIGVDGRNGFDASDYLATGGDYDDFRSVLMSMGHTIVPLTSYDGGNLAGIDAIITMNPYNGSGLYSASEMAAISNFVAGGRGMLSLGEGGGASDANIGNMNAITGPLGGTFSGSASNAAGIVVSDFVAHPVTMGLSQVGIDFNRTVAVSGTAIDLVATGEDFLAVNDGMGGAGNVAFVGDQSFLKDDGTGSDFPLSALDNEQLLRNLVDYITIPAPSTLAMIGCGGLAAFRRRR